MNTDRREDLIKKAEEVRSHMLETIEEFERLSHERVAYAGIPSSGPAVRTEGGQSSPERRRLERRADRVREHMIDAIEQIELKARERIVPIVIAGAATMFFLTIGFGVLLYRAVRR
ncbi:MAG: hypothetical protein HUU21_31555 [Polyangiaceae bacterium]|nr:hypothetical protein [Polyangiaceae bacterium]